MKEAADEPGFHGSFRRRHNRRRNNAGRRGSRAVGGASFAGISPLLFGVTAFEALDAAGGIDEFLLTGEERVAFRADADPDVGACGTGVDHVPTGADDIGFPIFGMDVRFHEKAKDATKSGKLKAIFARSAWRCARRSQKSCSQWSGHAPRGRGAGRNRGRTAGRVHQD